MSAGLICWPSGSRFAIAEMARRAIDDAVSKPEVRGHPSPIQLSATRVREHGPRGRLCCDGLTEAEEQPDGVHLPRTVDEGDDWPDEPHHKRVAVGLLVHLVVVLGV